MRQTGWRGCLPAGDPLLQTSPPKRDYSSITRRLPEAVDIPQILYNVPGRTACDMLPETIARLAQVPNIIGVKEATGDLSRLQRLRELCDDSFQFYSGDDATGCEFLLQGGHGVISVTANAAPRLMHEMSVAALAGRTEEARAIDARLAGLHSALFVESSPIPVKWVMMKPGSGTAWNPIAIDLADPRG